MPVVGVNKQCFIFTQQEISLCIVDSKCVFCCLRDEEGREGKGSLVCKVDKASGKISVTSV